MSRIDKVRRSVETLTFFSMAFYNIFIRAIIFLLCFPIIYFSFGSFSLFFVICPIRLKGQRVSVSRWHTSDGKSSKLENRGFPFRYVSSFYIMPSSRLSIFLPCTLASLDSLFFGKKGRNVLVYRKGFFRMREINILHVNVELL